MNDTESPTFEEPWPDTFVKGGKEWRFSQATRGPDVFVGYGADRSEPPSESWFDLMRMAYAVLTSENTFSVTSESPASNDLYVRNPVPEALTYFDDPYAKRERPYIFSGSNLAHRSTKPTFGRDWAEKKLIISGGLRLVFKPGTDDTWVHVPEGETSPAKPEVTWWELVRASAAVASSPNTHRVLDQMPEDVPPRFAIDRDTATDTTDTSPYGFAADVGADVNPRGVFDY